MPRTNPAARLHAILETVRNAGTAKPHSGVLEAWADALLYHAEESEAVRRFVLFERIVEVQRLVQQVNDLVTMELTNDANFLLEHYDQIIAFVTLTNLDQPYQGIRNLLTDVNMRDVAHIARSVPLELREEEIPGDELVEFLEQIEELSATVADDEIDPELRTILLELLEAMRHAVSIYRICGAAAFRKVLARSIGDLLIHQELIKKDEGSPAVSGFGKLFGRLVYFASQAKPVVDLLKAGGEIVLRLVGSGPEKLQ